MPCDNTGRHWGDASSSQGTPRMAGGHLKLRGGEEGPFPGFFRDSMALVTPGFQTPHLQNGETTTVLV